MVGGRLRPEGSLADGLWATDRRCVSGRAGLSERGGALTSRPPFEDWGQARLGPTLSRLAKTLLGRASDRTFEAVVSEAGGSRPEVKSGHPSAREGLGGIALTVLPATILATGKHCRSLCGGRCRKGWAATREPVSPVAIFTPYHKKMRLFSFIPSVVYYWFFSLSRGATCQGRALGPADCALASLTDAGQRSAVWLGRRGRVSYPRQTRIPGLPYSSEASWFSWRGDCTIFQWT